MANKFKQFVLENKRVLIIIGVIIVAGLATLLIVNLINNQPQSSEELQQNVEQQTEQIITNIGSEIILPDDETPIMSIIVDKSQLEGDIFENAQDGDKVLIYENAGLMVVYRESTNEIIATGPVGTGSVGQDNNVPAGVDQ